MKTRQDEQHKHGPPDSFSFIGVCACVQNDDEDVRWIGGVYMRFSKTCFHIQSNHQSVLTTWPRALDYPRHQNDDSFCYT